MQAHPTIIVVDDNAGNRLLPGLILRPLGFQVLECASGQEAVALMAKTRVVAVLLDIDMPSLNCLAMLPAIKQSQQTQPMEVIACTANASPKEAQNLIVRGFDGVLLKPIKSSDLVKILIK